MTPKMRTIAELVGLTVTPEASKKCKPVVTPIKAPLSCPETVNLPRKFECEVFNFLLENKEDLGVETVFRFKNLLVDGAILLTDGRRLAVGR
jgi:hypothetical protein